MDEFIEQFNSFRDKLQEMENNWTGENSKYAVAVHDIYKLFHSYEHLSNDF